MASFLYRVAGTSRRNCAMMLAATSLAAAAPALASQRPSSLKLEPIQFKLSDGTELPAERGTFLVPENRADPSSRQIELSFVRFRSTSPRPGAPLVYLAGGPGGS